MKLENLIRIENGEKVKHTFSDAEYPSRQNKLRELMARENIDAVLFTSYHNINYYADSVCCSFGRKYGLAVTPKKVVSIPASIDGGQPWRRTVGDFNLVYTDWQRDNFFRAVQGRSPTRGSSESSSTTFYAEYGLLQYRTFGYGHSFGVLSHYYGREAGLELREDIDTVLEPNMVISMEPMIMLPQGLPGAGGYREHDILVIGEKDATNITAFPYGRPRPASAR
jgi:Xaa-Pro aminopeptidase